MTNYKFNEYIHVLVFLTALLFTVRNIIIISQKLVMF